jgi:hypothetical protein
MQQMYRNFLTDLEKFGVASQTRPRMRAFGRSVTRPKDSFSVVFELAAKDDGKVNRQNPRALPRVCVCVSVCVSLSSDAHLLLKFRFAAAAISDIEFLLVVAFSN